ncbi:9227_t:CDS:2 [Paraglomus brasilianum]|uniref:9227_t:CDS:1 n=1 Tax=Paraglomus brasilianum TaxID=144538 RepID=A0A9N8VVA1_9GLOM|nr:9227_t:CDS:2 [Paraglomus brasilianum]
MVHCNAIIKHRSTISHFIGPVIKDAVVQLGGSEPEAMAMAVKIIEENGCTRVQRGCFGATLMKTPEKLAQILYAIQEKGVHIPVTIKCRTGVDEVDSYEDLSRFISVLSKTDIVRHIIIHARKCWINGISPKKNRQIPPLDYSRVRRIAEEFPHINFSINGGIDSIESINEHLNNVDGVMIGRKVIKDPLFLSDIEQELYGTQPKPFSTVISEYLAYATEQSNLSLPFKPSLNILLKPIYNLIKGTKGKRYRTLLQEKCRKCRSKERTFNGELFNNIVAESLTEILGSDWTMRR